MPKPKFIKEVLLKCLRLSYHQRIKDSVPEGFGDFVPEKPAVKFKFSGEAGTEENTAGVNLSAKLTTAIKSKCTQEEIQNILKEVSDEEQDQQFNQLKVSYFAV